MHLTLSFNSSLCEYSDNIFIREFVISILWICMPNLSYFIKYKFIRLLMVLEFYHEKQLAVVWGWVGVVEVCVENR